MAVLLKFVFDLAGEGQRLGTSHVDAAILKLFALNTRTIEDGDRNQAAGFRMAWLAGPLEHGDGAQHGSIMTGSCDLAGVLGDERECGVQEEDCQRNSTYR